MKTNTKKMELAEITRKLEELNLTLKVNELNWNDDDTPYRIVTSESGRKWSVGRPKTESEIDQEISRLRTLPGANGETVQGQIRFYEKELYRLRRRY